MTEPHEAPDPQPALPSIASVADLVDLLMPVTAGGKELWYRGHRNVVWSLDASVFRNPLHRANEKAMLARFRQEAAVAGIPFDFDDWGWITYAQHHLLPTRLLDWSISPLVALFFACELGKEVDPKVPEPDGQFLLLQPHDLNDEAGDAGGGHPRLLSAVDELLKGYLPGKDASGDLKPRAVVAPLKFDRIRFQTGTFTITQTPADSEPETLRKARSLQTFLIPSSKKPSLRGELAVLGFNEVSIYRDLDRIATQIRTIHGRKSI